MAILKAGFTPGFRGRSETPAWNRRAYYLASEHERDSVRLLGMYGRVLNPDQAIEAFGGPHAQFHEVIVAPSDLECRSIEGRNPENPEHAIEDTGHRIAKAHAKGRPYVLAIHFQDGRFHYHIAVTGPMPERTLGRQGSLQKQWTREFFGDEPRILDWGAHQRFKAEKIRLNEVIQEQRSNEHQRYQALKGVHPSQKAEVARPFELKARELIERRYGLELKAIQARYEARGTLGSPRHQAEVEQAEHRRTGSLRRLEKREMSRELGAAKVQLGQAVDLGGRVVHRGTLVIGQITRASVDRALKELGAPLPIRKVTRGALVLSQEAAQTLLRASQAAAKATARSSLHIAQASLKISVGLLAVIPSGGASLKVAGKEAGQDLAQAGKELGQGMTRMGAELGKGTARAIAASGQALIPQEIRSVVQAATGMASTAARSVKDVLTLSPISLGQTLAVGALDLSKTAARATGAASSLPEPLRLAFQIAGWVPVVGIAAKAAQLAAETAKTAVDATSRGLEVDR